MPRSLAPWIRGVVAQHAEAFDECDLAAGQRLFSLGDASDALYVVLSGTLDVFVGDPATTTPIDTLHEGDVVGEMGLLVDQARTATIVAPEAARLLRLPRDAFERLRGEEPPFARALAEQASQRWHRVVLTKALGDLFGSDLDPAELHNSLHERVTWHTVQSGESLCRQGDEGHSMYIIVSGRVVFEVGRPDGSVTVVGEAGAGEAVGEFSLLTEAPRSADVVAARQTTYVEISRELFTDLITVYPSILFSLSRQLAGRQQRVHTHGLASLAPSTLTVALVPANADVSVRPLAEDLVAALGRLGTARLIDVARTQEVLGAGVAETSIEDPLHAVVMQWLNEQEAETNYLVFLADAAWTPWTQRCISRADRVLVVARPDDSEALSETERRLAGAEARCDRRLVLWHPPETAAPLGTARWLDARPGYRHIHVRRGDPAHTARLARLVAEEAVGLVLSGGGARGFAHIGVFRSMEELGLPMDAIGGSSFGALIGALRASDRTTDEILSVCDSDARNALLFDRTLPVVALNASHNLTTFCQRLYGDQQIEDLWLPFFAVAVNLSRGETVVLRRGPLWRAIRSSIAVPGVFAPVVEDGELMVDGGVLNNFPVDVMLAETGSERIIGAWIGAGGGKPRTYDMDTGVSGWGALARRLNPFASTPQLPYLSRVIMRTLFVGSAPLSERNHSLADLVLPLDIRASLLNFEPFRTIAEAGYEQSLNPLREWAAGQPDLGSALGTNGVHIDGAAASVEPASVR